MEGRAGWRGVLAGEGADRDELGERFGEVAAVDLFGVDLESLEECLVEKAALGRVGLKVGGLDVVGEAQCEVERVEDGVAVDLVPLHELFGCDPFPADPLLLLGEDVVADRVVVVGVEEFPFFVVEAGDFCACAGGLFVCDPGESVDVGVDGGADAFALGVDRSPLAC